MARSVAVQLLKDAHGVLHDLLVSGGRVVAEWLNDGADVKVFERLPALLVNTQVTNGEQGDSSWRLAGALVILDNVEQLLECTVLDQVFAQSIGVSHEVTESTRGVCSSLLLLVSQQLNQQYNAWTQMLIENVVVETGVTNSEAGKLPCVSVWIAATLDSCSNQAKLK